MSLIIYILALEQNKYYVGRTTNLNTRFQQHLSGQGSEWTKLYKPINIIKTYNECVDIEDEDKYTFMMMKKYGIENVRGGNFSTVELSKAEEEVLKKIIIGNNNGCYNCGKTNHYIAKCNEIDYEAFIYDDDDDKWY